jgi:hypothetical protein
MVSQEFHIPVVYSHVNVPSPRVIEYFKQLANGTGASCRNLISYCLSKYAHAAKQPTSCLSSQIRNDLATQLSVSCPLKPIHCSNRLSRKFDKYPKAPIERTQA